MTRCRNKPYKAHWNVSNANRTSVRRFSAQKEISGRKRAMSNARWSFIETRRNVRRIFSMHGVISEFAPRRLEVGMWRKRRGEGPLN
jgi:hypothetical protein